MSGGKRFSMAPVTAPTAGEPIGVPTPVRPDIEAPRPRDVVPSRRRDVSTSEKSAFTLRMDLDQEEHLDKLVRDLRRAVGRRVTKSDVLLALVQLAGAEDDVWSPLVKRLRGD